MEFVHLITHVTIINNMQYLCLQSGWERELSPLLDHINTTTGISTSAFSHYSTDAPHSSVNTGSSKLGLIGSTGPRDLNR